MKNGIPKTYRVEILTNWRPEGHVVEGRASLYGDPTTRHNVHYAIESNGVYRDEAKGVKLFDAATGARVY